MTDLNAEQKLIGKALKWLDVTKHVGLNTAAKLKATGRLAKGTDGLWRLEASK